MHVTFRPLPALSLLSAILFLALAALGVWQLERLRWKLSLINEVHQNMSARPLSLEEALTLGQRAQYRRVQVDGRFDNAKESYVFGTAGGGEVVFHVVVPFRTTTGRTILIDRGIVPQALRDPTMRPRGLVDGPTSVVGIWREHEQPGPFSPGPDLEKHVWYWHDVAGIARDRDVSLSSQNVLEADGRVNRGGWPKGGHTTVNFSNEHVQYAITWFLLAAGLLGIYLAYHVSCGRLTFSR